MKYKPQEIEPKWQDYWEKNNFYRAKDFSDKPKKYLLIEFPYPSGEGLHVGHCRSYSAMDAVVRKNRMRGFNVLFPIGWDAFGLPAENYAIKTGIHPSKTTQKNIENYRRQCRAMGLSFDWDREVNTTDPKYYKWTQWIFLKLLENDLAYQATIPINWCPSCKIGLANEEVVAGKCERCGAQVTKKELKQWMLKITKYAERLINDLETVDYLDKIKAQQLEWVGRSPGSEVDFKVQYTEDKITVFTTRIDTLFGATAIVLAPEHELVQKLTAKEHKEKVEQYIKESKEKTEFERTKLEKEKTGVFTGSYCVNPADNKQIPIWIGDYVVSYYGGGAVMVVPAHDKRDYEFAKNYGLQIKEVIKGGNIKKEPFVEYGVLINSEQFNGLSSREVMKEITRWLATKNLGREKVNYKLRDWVFSRQHYWGEPIPVIHCEKCGVVPVSEKDLPVELPYIEKYEPTDTGESPLAAISDWVNVKCPKCKGPAKRETDTMPNWAGSNWYFVRYCDPKNDKQLIGKKKAEYWLPVNWYNGGMEHTTLHLLYSRFIYKFLYDIKVVPNPEPYQKRTSHGVVLAEDNQKMSKSRGNVINPDDIIKECGADTLRLYEMFMGPFDQTIAWSSDGVKGVFRFLNKFWDLATAVSKNAESSQEVTRKIHQLNKKVGSDIEITKFNTAIAAFMEFVNFAKDHKPDVGKDTVERSLMLLAPFAPHATEELWHFIGHKDSIHEQDWPEYDQNLIKEEVITLVVQVNGRMRDKIEVEIGISEDKAKDLTLSREKIKKILGQRQIRKVIFVSDKLINIVV